MTFEKKNIIASSFSDKFEEFDLDLRLSKKEFSLFDNGIYSNSMDDKWNIFVLDNFIYFARSWTDHCIFNVAFNGHDSFVILSNVIVTKDKTQYNSNDVQQDKNFLLRIIQMYVGRDDIYVDPEFQFDLIKRTLLAHDPNDECKRSIGHNDVGLTKRLYDALTTIQQYIRKQQLHDGT
jgi:hypothetical protein